MSETLDCEVLVIGSGPGGATTRSPGGPAQSECATNPLGDFFNTPFRIAGLQRLLGRQGVSFW